MPYLSVLERPLLCQLAQFKQPLLPCCSRPLPVFHLNLVFSVCETVIFSWDMSSCGLRVDFSSHGG